MLYRCAMIRSIVCRAYTSLSGWKLETQPAPHRPTVFIGAPHTSNWDFVIMLVIAWSLDMDVNWLGKNSLFKGPAGPIMRALGGIEVDRANPKNLVKDLVERMHGDDSFALVVAPDGTRGHHTHWKSGFYRVALDTGMPVTLGYVDRTTKTFGLGPTVDLTGDAVQDMDKFRAFYADKAGYHPQKRVEPRLQEEDRTA